ncbi:putative AraC-like transcription regulator [uncultured Pleomorphomonas sp.]|uniref:Putative AraC-like transcription regulator n=2 Tax=uncultured Pleomorphomonas sp. TaxID=442121 RepID=A0A212L7J7_9HYPH|nr:putative AraC-like transcription regulator [uncultured Pleomorphomonas sp.]
MLESALFMRESTKMTIDPLSEVLNFANVRPIVSGGIDAGGEWALRFQPPDRLKFFAIARGECWLLIDDTTPLRLGEGDVFLITQTAFTLCSDPALEAADAHAAFAGVSNGHARLGDGSAFSLLGGHIVLDPEAAGFMGGIYPRFVHVPAGSPHASVSSWLLARLVEERRSGQPGTTLAMGQLSQLLFIEIMRAHLLSSTLPPPGLLRAVADERLAPALSLVHADPSRQFDLNTLAAAAAMSRTAFIDTFKAVSGTTPMAYVAQWRMHLAAKILRDEDTPIAEVAHSLGYGSESAFSNAFKRVVGEAPRLYRSRFQKADADGEACGWQRKKPLPERGSLIA